MPKAGRPRGLRGFARRALVLAWVIFWINTALFPCCEAVAAAFGDHSDDVSQSVSAAQPAHAAGGMHSEPPTHSPSSPCGYTLTAGPTNVGMYATVTIDHSSPEWLASDTPAAPSLTAANHSANLAPRPTPPTTVSPLPSHSAPADLILLHIGTSDRCAFARLAVDVFAKPCLALTACPQRQPPPIDRCPRRDIHASIYPFGGGMAVTGGSQSQQPLVACAFTLHQANRSLTVESTKGVSA